MSSPGVSLSSGSMEPLSARRTMPTLTPEQLKAVELSRKENLVILTGGPGTGKTTTIRSIVSGWEDGSPIALAAPTGKAARRIQESIGSRDLQAKTLHRLLEYSQKTRTFARDADNPIDAGLLVVDECSMLPVDLAASLFQAVKPETRVVLVGDPDQLPPVGPGAVLLDLIASRRCPTVHLSVIHRQSDATGGIVVNAHRINGGLLPTVEADDFAWLREDDPERIIDRVLSSAGTPNSIVLAPQYKGAVGVTALNDRLKARLNPGEGLPHLRLPNGQTIHLGDPVMQTKNDYELEIFNGYVGRVVAIDPAANDDGPSLTVDFGENSPVEYATQDSRKNLVLSYAATVHKSQGSEYDTVIVVAHTSHAYMLSRSLLYTAVTRAKKRCILVGSGRAVELAVRNNRPVARQTRLRLLLQQR